MSKDNVIDFDGVRPIDQFEVVFTASGPFEQMADQAIATLRASDDPKDIDKAIAMLTFMGAKLDQLESEGVDLEG